MAVDVEQTLEALGIEGRTSGSEFTGHCPMHEKRTGHPDANPSWSINVDTGLFICFSCGYRGSILTLIADMTGVTIEQAKSAVVKPDLSATVAKIPSRQIKAKSPTVLPDASLSAYKPPPAWARARRHVTREACALYEVKWDFVNDRWILPIRRPTGELVGWQEKAEMGRYFRNYPFGVKKSACLFGYGAFTSGRMIVVESPLDAVRLHSNGVLGAVATYGSEVSRAQILLMSAADEVVFALDNYVTDEAGMLSSKRLIQETRGVLAAVRFFNYSGIGAKDPGDMTPEEIEQGIAFAKSRAYGERAIS